MSQKNKIEKKKSHSNSVPRWYLIYSIIISAGSILTNLVYNETVTINPFTIALNIILFAWLVTNIVMLTRFVNSKVDKGAIWLAGIYLFDFVFSFAIAFVAGFYASANNLTIDAVANLPLIRVLLNVFPVITLVLAFVLYYKK